MEKNRILQALVINEEEEFKKIVEKAKRVIKIKTSGEPIILASKDKVTDAEYIVCYLLGKYFSKELGFVQSATATNAEIAKSLQQKYPKLNFITESIDREWALPYYQKINIFQPDIIFVTLGSPYQEKFIYHKTIC